MWISIKWYPILQTTCFLEDSLFWHVDRHPHAQPKKYCWKFEILQYIPTNWVQNHSLEMDDWVTNVVSPPQRYFVSVSGLQYELREPVSNRLWSVQQACSGCAWQGPLSATATAMSTVGAGVTSPGQTGARMPTAPKRPVRRGGKPPPDRPQRALCFLYLKNPVRKLCIDVVEWKYPFSWTFFIVSLWGRYYYLLHTMGMYILMLYECAITGQTSKCS